MQIDIVWPPPASSSRSVNMHTIPANVRKQGLDCLHAGDGRGGGRRWEEEEEEDEGGKSTNEVYAGREEELRQKAQAHKNLQQ